MSENLPPTGQVGSAPPPDAPVETSQPLTAEAGAIPPGINPRTGESYAREDWHSMSPSQRARHNERTLAPLTYITQPKVGGVAEAVEAVAADKIDPFYGRLRDQTANNPPSTAARRILRRPRPEVSAAESGPAVEPSARAEPDLVVEMGPDRSSEVDVPPAAADPGAVDPFAPVDLTHFPAASNSDSPSRGQPRIPVAAGKAITGGFGDQAALEYFALTGKELLYLVQTLMDDLNARLVNDLRFSEALTYPQVSARVVVEVTGFGRDDGFLIDKVLPAAHEARTKTPTAIAREQADEICFVVLAERRETDVDGQPVEAPDAIRQALELPRPGKRQVRGPGGVTQWVDVR
jgi:hypothetical protein